MYEVIDFALQFRCPYFWVFEFDGVDQVNAKVQMYGLVAQDVLELFAYAGHAVLAMEGEDHDKATVKEDAFHDDVKADEIFHEFLHPFNALCCEVGIQYVFGQFHYEFVFAFDGGDFVIHVEYFACV